MTIEELEGLIAQRLREPFDHFPERLGFRHHRLHITLFDREGKRKKKRNASAESWSPASGGMWLTFEDGTEASDAMEHAPGILTDAPEGDIPRQEFGAPASPDRGGETSPEIRDLVRSLDQAESRPGYDFVALKWFRDVVLAGARPAWANDSEARNRVLRDAIERRLVLTSKVPNPKSPAFPVTAVRLNRTLLEVRTILGSSEVEEVEFRPAEIRGGPLSTTILRERR